jgi:hypothetical protein
MVNIEKFINVILHMNSIKEKYHMIISINTKIF